MVPSDYRCLCSLNTELWSVSALRCRQSCFRVRETSGVWSSGVAVKVRPLACSHRVTASLHWGWWNKEPPSFLSAEAWAVGARVSFISFLARKRSLSQRMIFFSNRGCNATTRLLCSPLRVGREIAAAVERCVAINNRSPHGLLQFHLIRFNLRGTFSYWWPRSKLPPFSFLASAHIILVLKLMHVVLTPHVKQFNNSLTYRIGVTGFSVCQMRCHAHSHLLNGPWPEASQSYGLCYISTWRYVCAWQRGRRSVFLYGAERHVERDV